MDVKLWNKEIPHLLEDADTPNAMTFYPVECEEELPCVVVFAGGGYSHRADYEGEPIALYFNRQGFHAFVVHYRIAPYTYPAPLEDAQRAVKLIRKNATSWKIDPDRIYTLGFSAGAHLAAYSALTDDVTTYGDEADAQSHRPNGVILCYPMLASENGPANTVHGCFSRIIPEGSGRVEADYEPERLLTENAPPFFIWHTARDGCCAPAAALSFAARLCELKVHVEAHLFAGGHHGGGLWEESPVISSWASLAADWVRRNGQPG